MSDRFRSATTISSSLLDRWSALVSASAAEMDAGTYNASDAVRDTVDHTVLAAEGTWRWTAWWWECFAGMGGQGGGLSEPNTCESQTFPAPAGAKLEFEGPLLRGPGLEALAGISIPQQLEPDEDEFTLRFDGRQCRGGTYVGKVKPTTDAGAQESVWVWISIP